MAQRPAKTGTATKTQENVFQKIISGLGLKKNPRERLQDEKKLIDEIIKENNKLYDRLKIVLYKANEADKRTIATLLVRLSDYDMSTMPDTRVIDSSLYLLCDQLEDAYQKGDSLTAQYIIQAFVYGIANGHKPLMEYEQAKEAEVMQWREKKVITYVNMIEAAKNVFQFSQSIKANEAKIVKDNELLELQNKEIEEFENDEKNAGALDSVETAGGRLSDLTGGALKYANMMLIANRTFKEIEMLSKDIAVAEAKLNDYKSKISTMEHSLNQANEQSQEKINEFIKDLGDDLLVRINSQLSDVYHSEALLNDYYNSVDAAFKSPELAEYVLGALNSYKKMQRKMDDQKASYDRRRKRLNKPAQTNTNELEN